MIFFTQKTDSTQRGFTLAELLIALAILGVIATFTIPKVLVTQQNQQWNAEAKEAASMITGAYQAYQAQNTPDANTTPAGLTPYMNYVVVDTSTTIDEVTGLTSVTCGAASSGGHIMCMRLHNGAMLEYVDTANFTGTSSTNLIFFYLDPDGKYSGSATGNGKSIMFVLYFNGKLRTWGSVDPNSYGGIFGGTTYNPDSSKDPSWFSWS